MDIVRQQGIHDEEGDTAKDGMEDKSRWVTRGILGDDGNYQGTTRNIHIQHNGNTEATYQLQLTIPKDNNPRT